jgi:hypothetical protein
MSNIEGGVASLDGGNCPSWWDEAIVTPLAAWGKNLASMKADESLWPST